MTLQQLRYVIALDQYRHFVTASGKAFVSQSTLSIQIKKLEDEMGVVLFDRKSHPLVPTTTGELFIQKARYILREVEALQNMVKTEQQQLSGEYRLAIIPTLAPYLLSPFLQAFAKKHSETRLQLEESQSAEIIQQLLDGRLDVAIVSTPLQEPELREIPLFYEPFLLFAHAAHVLLKKGHLVPEDLETEHLWLLSQGHCFRNQTANICQRQRQAPAQQLAMEAGSIETLKSLVSGLGGYTLIPELSYQPSLEAAQVKRFADPQPVREVSLVVHRSFSKERLFSHLRDAILTHIPDHFKQNRKAERISWR